MREGLGSGMREWNRIEKKKMHREGLELVRTW